MTLTLAWASLLKRIKTDAALGGLKLQCIAIATFSSYILMLYSTQQCQSYHRRIISHNSHHRKKSVSLPWTSGSSSAASEARRKWMWSWREEPNAHRRVGHQVHELRCCTWECLIDFCSSSARDAAGLHRTWLRRSAAAAVIMRWWCEHTYHAHCGCLLQVESCGADNL